MIHLLMFADGVPLFAGIFLEITREIIALMIVAFFVHEATALWDVSYAVTARDVNPIEQHVHSFLETILLMVIISIFSLHWRQFQALFEFGSEPPRFDLVRKEEQLPHDLCRPLDGCHPLV